MTEYLPPSSAEPTPVHVGRLPSLDRNGGDDEMAAPFDLHVVMATLRRRRAMVLFGTALAGSLAATYSYFRTPEYQATAVIRLADNRRAVAGALGGDADQTPTGRTVDPLQSLIETLMSRRVASTVVDSVPVLRLHARGFPLTLLSDLRIDSPGRGDSIVLRFGRDRIGLLSAHGVASAAYGEPIHLGGVRFVIRERPREAGGTLWINGREVTANRLLASLKVAPRPNTDVVDVSYVDSDAVLARDVADRVVENFQLVNAQAAQHESRVRREFVEEQLHENQTLLAKAQAALSAFRADAQLYSSKERLTAEESALASINIRRQELEADLALYRQALRALEINHGDLAAISTLVSAPNVAANPVITQEYGRLVSLRAARDTLTAGPWGRGDSHPDILRIDSLIHGAEGNLHRAVGSLIASVEARIRGIDDLKAQNAAAFRAVSGKETAEGQLVEQVEALRATATQLQAEYQRAKIAEAVEVGQVEIVDAATAPHRIGLSPGRLVLFGGLAGFIGTWLLALLFEQLNTSIRRQGQAREALNLPELAVIPQLDSRILRKLRAHMPPALGGRSGNGGSRRKDVALTVLDGQSSGAEAYRVLRTNLLFSQASPAPRSIVVTSPSPGDGKTTVAVNLAVAFAQQGFRVVLVDADLRQGGVHRLLGTANTPGLSEVLHGRSPLAQAICSTAVPQLMVVPVGQCSRETVELVGSWSMGAVLEELTQSYDVVMIDAPPVLAVADALVIAPLADATILVLRGGKTPVQEAQHAAQQLWTVGAKLVGAVLNDQDATIRSYGGYHARYYQQYGSKRS
jgi:succinoglycan biosynthesis transport protein ExoP